MKIYAILFAIAINKVLSLAALDATYKHQFQKAVQQFGYSCHEMVNAKKITDIYAPTLSKQQLAVIEKVEDVFTELIAKIREDIESSDSDIQMGAVINFGNYVLELARYYNLRTQLVIRIAPSLDTEASIESHITKIDKAVSCLASYFSTIRPQIDLHTRLTNKLLYNYTTTKIIPNVLKYVIGPLATTTCGLLLYRNYIHAVAKDSSKSIWQIEQPCNLPTEIEAFDQRNKASDVFIPALEEYIKCAQDDALVKKKDELLEELTNARNSSDLSYKNKYIQRLIKKIKRYTHYGLDHIENLEWNPATQLKTKIDNVKRTYNAYQQAHQTYEKASHHHCDIPGNYDKNGNRTRGKDKRYKISYNLTAEQNIKNVPLFTKDVIWSLRPLLIYFGLKKAATHLENKQIELFNRKQRDVLARLPVDKALRNVVVQRPNSNNFGPAASAQYLISHGYKTLVQDLKNPLFTEHNGVLLHGTNDTKMRSILYGLAIYAKNTPIISLGPLAASNRANVQATMEKALEETLKRDDKSVIIHLEDADYIACESKALSNIKEIIFNHDNPYIKITVIATATEKDKMAPELVHPDYLPFVYAVA